MNSLTANLLNEIDKILARKKTFAFLIFAALIPIGGAITLFLFQNNLGMFSFSSDSFPILILGLLTNFFLPLFVFAMAADLFAGEFGDKTLKITLTRPVSRFNIFLSKNIAIGAFILINLLLVFILSIISALFLKGTFQLRTGLFQGFVAYLMAFVPMLSISIIAVFISQFFKNSSGALTTSIFVYIAGKLLPFLLPKTGQILPFTYTDWHMLWIGSFVGVGRLFNIFMIFVSYSIIFFTAGYYLFDKKEL